MSSSVHLSHAFSTISSLLNPMILNLTQVVLATILFGLSFVGQRRATDDDAGPLTYNAWRYIVSVVVVFSIRRRIQSTLHTDTQDSTEESNALLVRIKSLLPCTVSNYAFDLYIWGVVLGVLNFSLSAFQQYGLRTVTAGKAAFINGLFVVVTPFAEALLPCYNSSITPITWIAVFVSGIGTYFLSGTVSSGDGTGEILLVLAMLCCCLSILAADAGAKRVDCVDLTIVELTTCAVMNIIVSLIMEPEMWQWPLIALQVGWPMVVCVGITEGFGFTLGTIGQMYIPPHRASLLFGLEGVATCLLGYVLLGELLTPRELFGCALMLTGTLIYSTPVEEKERESEDGAALIPLLPTTGSPCRTIHFPAHVVPVRPRSLSVSHSESSAGPIQIPQHRVHRERSNSEISNHHFTAISSSFTKFLDSIAPKTRSSYGAIDVDDKA